MSTLERPHQRRPPPDTTAMSRPPHQRLQGSTPFASDNSIPPQAKSSDNQPQHGVFGMVQDGQNTMMPPALQRFNSMSGVPQSQATTECHPFLHSAALARE